ISDAPVSPLTHDNPVIPSGNFKLKEDSAMKLFLVAIALAGCAALVLVSPHASAVIKSKVEPDEVTLSKDAKDPKAKAVLLTHKAHSTKNYSEDGKSVIACTVCHHTDQPKSALTGVLKTSERDAVLTSALLKDAAAADVKTCRECHAQEGQKPAAWPDIPKVEYPDEGEVILTNQEAYHRNCTTCHETVKKRDAATKAPTSCAGCHNGGTKS